MLRIATALMILFLSSQSMAENWNIENYRTGTQVSYRSGETYHIELLPVIDSYKVRTIMGSRLPSRYCPDLLAAVKKGTVKISYNTEGKRTINLVLRHVDPTVAKMLPVLDMDDKVIGHISPTEEGANWLRYDNILLTGPIGIVTPISLWNGGTKPGYEVKTGFDILEDRAGYRTLQSDVDAMRRRLNVGTEATMLCLVAKS